MVLGKSPESRPGGDGQSPEAPEKQIKKSSAPSPLSLKEIAWTADNELKFQMGNMHGEVPVKKP
ncbi:TPA: hypothetical protein DEQ95_03265 [Candidatus Beckwithbacteria bacterium]|nr:MAG: hypothetical protein UY43_C0001G0471 [Candidatus Beckwithbacteria bacterium GW2011_GWC1_49_16]OGD48199.1 MAG: hypothetical protein A2877_02920 [Candidatus Beckwithbacteria bacterium RIFCSPHIGHO2_01_FULL_49_39]OGD50196.1 MAG: hypothetical protein A3K56_00675 [Candidatus Beckwithbacteria bacterium RIFCSPHIGHO2_12_FULL_49_13]OGD51298.1 MAG: hypothetical protein A3D86_03540 [Candidatus Beckwithbacteria bacterium RIFCSPHIGHO2_02_FULL_49_13]OGD57640.1 MAG: hypothetical protein A3J22_03935 [Ca